MLPRLELSLAARLSMVQCAHIRGRTCLCNGDPKCRYHHRLKQDPRWTAGLLPGGYLRWTTPAGRQYTTEPTRYPI